VTAPQGPSRSRAGTADLFSDAINQIHETAHGKHPIDNLDIATLIAANTPHAPP